MPLGAFLSHPVGKGLWLNCLQMFCRALDWRSYLTTLCRLIIAPNGVAYAPPDARPGILPRLLQEILSTRIMVKAAMKRAPKSAKVLLRTYHKLLSCSDMRYHTLKESHINGCKLLACAGLAKAQFYQAGAMVERYACAALFCLNCVATG